MKNCSNTNWDRTSELPINVSIVIRLISCLIRLFIPVAAWRKTRGNLVRSLPSLCTVRLQCKWCSAEYRDRCTQYIHVQPTVTHTTIKLTFFLFQSTFSELRKSTYNFVMSAPPPFSCSHHDTTRLPLNGFSWNLIFEQLSQIFRENSILIKIWREKQVLYMTTDNIF